MRQLPTLHTTDRHECRFLLFDRLEALWARINAGSASDDLPGSGTAIHPGQDSGKLPDSETASQPGQNAVILPNHDSHLVVVDERVLSLHREKLERAFPPSSSRFFEVPSGESSKSADMWRKILDFAFSGPLRRNTPLIAVGGGVAGDLSGFAAASLLRGLPLVQVPTTLLAMVDSAIGGKTGINHPFGKNTIGAFYHPEAVLFDTAFLVTLPEREWRCGISEVLKYGYIRDPELLEMGARLADSTTRNEKMLQEVIQRSVRIKSEIVAADAREAGSRAWLNFGHTFAHALETLDGYRNINHGEAVYAGMIAALYVSRQTGADVSDQELLSLQKVYNLNLEPYRNSIGELISLMTHDKKNRDETIRLVLLREYGLPEVQRMNDKRILEDAWRYLFDVTGRS